MFTCAIRYVVDRDKLAEFEKYARTWIALVEKHGGTHHGYFVPAGAADTVPQAGFSFPGLGTEGPDNIALALFSFPSVASYDRYRQAVAQDDACIAATARFNASKCFSSYERSFLKPIFR